MGGFTSIATLSVAVLAGCVTAPDLTPPQELADTEWTLIDYRMPSSASATEVELNKYQLRLAKGGQASLILDCNRAAGSWDARSTGTASGRLHVGKLAATMMLCNDNGLGERLARELGSPASYSIYDGRLTLRTETGTAWTFDIID